MRSVNPNDDAPEVGPGTLLVAAPSLSDPNFARTVVYLIDHNESGTFGVILNRRSETSVHDVLPDWGSYASKPAAVFFGGPVEPKTAICLANVRTGVEPESVPGAIEVQGPIAIIDLDRDPADIIQQVKAIRVFAGYSGWSAGQLDNEIARGDWYVVPALPVDVVIPPDVDLWARVLRRQPLPLALLATFPTDLTRN